MNKPSVTEGLNSVEFMWPELKLKVLAERIQDEGYAELQFFSNNGTGELLLHTTRANLLSTPTMNSLAKRLEKNSRDIPWEDILTYICGKTISIVRRGEPVVPVGKKPEIMKVEHQLAPILERNQPTTIYGPGGSAKSYLADYIAVLVQLDVVGIMSSNSSWTPIAGNVLYLDWEASKTDHDRRVWAIKKGLGIDSEETFYYRFCSQPLVNDIHSIQSLVSENQIDLAIVDSQMAATGYGPDQAQVASQFYNALRSLRCTTLTLDHVSKEDWKSSDSVGPYGSVVKYNRSRSQFEIKKSQDAGDDFIELSLIHRKHNEGKLLRPIGIRIKFNENAGGQLESVTFESCDVADNPELSRMLPLSFQIKNLLREGPLTMKEIVEMLDKSEDVIKTTLSRMVKREAIVKLPEHKWGLRQDES
jgi:DNA-binding NarL/FixJ family response regulator